MLAERYFFIVLIFLLPAISKLNAQDLSARLDKFDQYVEQSRQKFEVPGCAVAIVYDGKVVFTKGYGHLSVKKDKRVDEKTIFGIMSTTKNMTAAALAMLADEGKLDWDDKVIDYLPDFRLYDPYVTRDLRVRDLLTHSAGLGNTDFLWADDPKADPGFILHQMRMAEPAYPFRGGFIYQNIMYLAAGKLVEKLSGMTWERFMKERIYTPLGMKNTFPNMAYSMQYQNRSMAHQRLDDKIIAIPEFSADPIAPAGATWSTIEDMAKWVQFMLEVPTDTSLIKAKNKMELTKPQVIITADQFYPTMSLTNPHWITYGLGWFQQDYRGSMLNFHTGSLDGRTAMIALMKDQNFGFYFFGNLDHAELRHALMLRAIDEFVFNDTNRDWSEEVFSLYAKIREYAGQRQQQVLGKRVEETQPSKDLEAYVGIYTHPFYGQIKVWLKDSTLYANDNISFEHWHYDTFLAQEKKEWYPPSLVQFVLDSVTGEVVSIRSGSIEFKKQ